MMGPCIALVLALLFVATIVAARAGYLGLSLDHQIRPLELATLAVNIFIAFFLQYFFASRSTDLRAEKDLLIDSTRDVLTIMRSCRDALDAYQDANKSRQEHKKTVLQLLRRLANGLDSIQTALGASQCYRLAAQCDAIRRSYLSYKQCATGGSFPTKRFTAEEVSSQSQTYRRLNRDLEDLVFKINQHR